ncbi:MAG: type II secretion system F family protein [Planctomycetota bacterium]|jgi:type IV pilus assembly protein PilC
MAVYEYTAKDQSGVELSGVYSDVDNVATLRRELAKTGYVLVKARREKNRAAKPGKINRSEVVTFAYKFAGMYSAGLSILRCLETLEQQSESQAFGHIIADIRGEIETGSNLENAFGKYRNIFSDFFLGMVEAGETGGKLAEALELSAVYLEKRMDLRRKVKSAFAYPVVVGITCLVVVTCLLIFVVPVFSRLYKQLKMPLPGPTQVLVTLSYLLREGWWTIPFAVSAVVILLHWLLKHPNFRAKWDNFKLNMPVFGRLNRMVVVSHFTRTFAILASVGVSLPKALNVASQVAHNHKLSEIAKELQQSVEAGNPVSASLKNYDIFPPMITQLAFSGEEAGELSQMLNKGVDFLDKDIERVVNALIIKLEPTLTLIMGIIVGFLLLGIYLPMYDYMQYLE